MASKAKPNLLFISVDQMRGDCLGILGHPVLETPNLDYLASRGVLFRNAYSAAPSCIPARAALFTGMSPRSHGRIGYRDGVPWNYPYTMPGELTKAGYHTQCVGKMHVHPARSLQGFHNVVLHDGYMHYGRNRKDNAATEWFDQTDDYLVWLRRTAGVQKDLTDIGLDCNSSVMARPWQLAEELHPTNWVVTESIDFLRRRDPVKPFFLWMSFVRPHAPLDPPQAYLDMYADEELPEPPVGDWVQPDDPERAGLNPTTISGNVRESMRRRGLAGYYALITHIDHQIGRFLQALYEYGELDNTIIVFTSDHGDMMGDHRFYRKALPYEGSAKVPLIIHDRTGTLGLKPGVVVDRVVELQDIMPTLLDAASVPIPETVDGRSLLPLGRGDLAAAWRTYIHGEHEYGELSNHYVTDGREKYIWFSQTGREQLFDLREDPRELRNLAGLLEAGERLKLWRERLVQELAGREEGYVQAGRLVAGRKPQSCLGHILTTDHTLEAISSEEVTRE